MLVHDRVNIGVAVAAESGLIVPGHQGRRHQDRHPARGGSQAAGGARVRAQADPDQTSGGRSRAATSGCTGVEHFTAIINPPESAILAVGADHPRADRGRGRPEPRYRLRYTLSVDHRVIDGALAAKFLQTLTSLVEHPWMIIA